MSSQDARSAAKPSFDECGFRPADTPCECGFEESAANESRHVSFSSVVDAFENQAERENAVIAAAKAYVAAHEKYSSNRAWGTKSKNDDSVARSFAHLRLIEAIKELGA